LGIWLISEKGSTCMDKSLPVVYNTINYSEVSDHMFSFVPQRIYNSLCDLTPAVLQSENISVLLMDFDNTIVPYTCDVPAKNVIDWLESVKTAGICLCVVSNTKKGRAPRFCQTHGIDCITHAKKPFQKGIKEALKRYGNTPGKIALVGDQIFTDVLGANCGGILSVLVTPIHLHNIWLKLRHYLELPMIYLGKRRLRRGKENET